MDDVAGISAVYGVSRALAVNRRARIVGYDLQGAKVAEEVRVCEVGPYAGFCMPSDTDLTDAQRRNRTERVNEALDAAHLLLSRGA